MRERQQKGGTQASGNLGSIVGVRERTKPLRVSRNKWKWALVWPRTANNTLCRVTCRTRVVSAGGARGSEPYSCLKTPPARDSRHDRCASRQGSHLGKQHYSVQTKGAFLNRQRRLLHVPVNTVSHFEICHVLSLLHCYY